MRLGETLPIYLIDNPRGGWIRGQLAAELAAVPSSELHIVPPVLPDAIPKLICGVLARDENWSRQDALGPFLSHLAVWERIAQGTGTALLIESMVELRALTALRMLTLPEDADLVFVGDRMMTARGVENAGHDHAKSFKVVSMIDILALIDSTASGPAADAYLITPAGAAKLVAACVEDGLFGFVGGRLVQYATTEADIKPFAPTSRAFSVARRHRHPQLPPKYGIVRGYGVTPAPLPARKPRAAADAASPVAEPEKV